MLFFAVQFHSNLLLASLVSDLATPHSFFIFKQIRPKHANSFSTSQPSSPQTQIPSTIILSRRAPLHHINHTEVFKMRSTIRLVLASLPLLAIAQDNSSSTEAVDIVPITIDGTVQLKIPNLWPYTKHVQATLPASHSQRSLARPPSWRQSPSQKATAQSFNLQPVPPHLLSPQLSLSPIPSLHQPLPAPALLWSLFRQLLLPPHPELPMH
jgi:hypothetical protein